MAVVFQQKRKIQQYLVPIFFAVVLAAVAVFWYGFNKKEPAPPTGNESLTATPAVKLNLEILKNPLIEKLEPFIGAKVFEGQVGRENPFMPY